MVGRITHTNVGCQNFLNVRIFDVCARALHRVSTRHLAYCDFRIVRFGRQSNTNEYRLSEFPAHDILRILTP